MRSTMRRPAVEQVLGKLIMDARFRDAFFRDPLAATLAARVELTARERDALGHIRLVRLPRSSGISMANGSATGSKKSVRNIHATVACPWIRRCRTVVDPSPEGRSLGRAYQGPTPLI